MESPAPCRRDVLTASTSTMGWQRAGTEQALSVSVTVVANKPIHKPFDESVTLCGRYIRRVSTRRPMIGLLKSSPNHTWLLTTPRWEVVTCGNCIKSTFNPHV